LQPFTAIFIELCAKYKSLIWKTSFNSFSIVLFSLMPDLNWIVT